MLGALIFLCVCSMPWFASILGQKLIYDKVAEIALDDLPDYDAIVAFSWLEPVKKNDSHALTIRDARLDSVFTLYKRHPAPIVISSSQHPGPPKPGLDEMAYAKAYLIRLGIPEHHVNIAEISRSSYEGASMAKQALDKLQIESFVFIESDQRMTRKFLVFKKLYSNSSMRILPFTHEEKHQRHKPYLNLNQWIPDVRALSWTTSILHEYFGILAYRIKGWI